MIRKQISPGVYLQGNTTTVYISEDTTYIVIYTPRDSRGVPTPYNATGDAPAPSFSYLLIV